MKKLITPALLSILFLSSCLSNKNDDNDSFHSYQQWYLLVSLQNDLVMDPFNIAYRLNIYLNETSQDTKDNLLKGLTLTKDGNEYILDFNPQEAPDNDLARYGRLTINTHGQDFNSEGAVWSIKTDDDNPYIVQKELYGFVEEKITNGKYTITNTGDKQWSINADRIYMRFITESLFCDWYLKVNIKQTKDGLDYASLISGAEFEMETDKTSTSGGRTVYDTRFRYEIDSPVLYSSKCPYQTKAGGSETIIRMDDYDLVGQDTVIFDMGRTLNCEPQYKITLIKNGEEYSQTTN
ncbi:MAG: hypothetical protein LUF90_04720 [Rikenellaceae bacterium]|nr:hypothetical protein [Rikenellaceae bacterium]